MQQLAPGTYFGDHYQKDCFNGLILTDTDYCHEYVDWHRHENPYFTYLLAGKLSEENKQKKYYLAPGDLVFHNWQDSHRNFKPLEFTRGFHVEIDRSWFGRHGIDDAAVEGSRIMKAPAARLRMAQLWQESKSKDVLGKDSIEMLLLDLFGSLGREREVSKATRPNWCNGLEEAIYDSDEQRPTLAGVSKLLGLHPVYFSRAFHRHYRKTFRQFVRELMLDKAVSMLLSGRHEQTAVAHACHFYDQSHFIACFRNRFGTTPRRFSRAAG